MIISTLLVLLAWATASNAYIESGPIAKTTSGVLLGQTITLSNNAQVYRFLGVPYAQPPLGPNRFEKPKFIENKTDLLVLTHQAKPTCIQMRHLTKAISPLLDVDEDHNVSSTKF